MPVAEVNNPALFGAASRRFVFSKGEDGKAVIEEGKAPMSMGSSELQLYVAQLFATGGVPCLDTISAAASDAVSFNKKLKPGEALFVVASVPPRTADAEIIKQASYPHSDPCLDFCIALQGEVDCVFQDSRRVRLKAGDFFVQGGLVHSWQNPGDEPFIFCATLVGATGDPQPQPDATS